MGWTRARRRVRLMVRVAVVILAGSATTVAVAWLGAAFEKAYHAASVSETLVFDTFTTRYFLVNGRTITRIGINWDQDASNAAANPAWIHAGTQAQLSHAPAWSQAWLTTRPQRPAGTW